MKRCHIKVLRDVSDLAHHALIMHAPRGRPRWTLVNGGRVERVDHMPRCTLNNTIAVTNMARAGLGIAQMPRYLAEPWVEAGLLERVLAN